MVIDGFPDLPKIVVSTTEISEAIPFTTPISDLPCNHKRILVVLDRFLDLPKIAVCIPKISEPSALISLIANLP